MVRNANPGQKSKLIKPIRRRKTNEKPINSLPVDSTFPLANDETYLSLSEKQKKFLYHYYLRPVTGWTVQKCYQMTDPKITKGSAAVISTHLIRKPSIKYCIDALQKRYNSELGVTTERLIEELANIGFSDIADYFNKDGLLEIHPLDLPASARRAISGFEEIHTMGITYYKVKLWNKLHAIKQITDMHGLSAPKKHEISGPNGQPIEHKIQYNIDLSLLKTHEVELLIKVIDKLGTLPQELMA